MMKHSFKRALSAFLALLLLCVSFAPAAAAAEEEYPIVYIYGMGSGLVDKDGKSIAAADVDKDYIVNSVKDVLKQMPIDPNGNWDKYCDALYDCFSPIYDDIRLDKNGEPSDGSHSDFVWRKEWLGRKTSNFKAEDYNFYYDWRVDPFVSAAELSKYIDAVREVTGKSKVTLVGRCLGSCIVTAYLQMTENVQDKVKNVIFYAPSVGGIGLLGALFSGQVTIDEKSLDRFINSYSDRSGLFEDSAVEALVVSAVSLARYLKVLGFGTDVIQGIYDRVFENLVPRLALTSYGSFPSFWSMIGTEYYESARDFVFKGKEDEYAKMIEKTDHFYYSVTARLPQLIDELSQKGVEFSYLAKYNFDLIPVFEGSDVQSDGLVELSTLSAGATSSKMGSLLSDEYIENAKKNGTDKYISADKLVDASTCRFPDRTWFLKNLAHSTMPDCVNPLIEKISRGNGDFTVWSDPAFPQYMTFDSETETFSPTVVEGDDFRSPPKDFISAIFRFFTSFFRYLAAAFEKMKNK